MAARKYEQFQLSLEKEVVTLYANIPILAVGAVGVLDPKKNQGIYSVVRNSVGNYTISFGAIAPLHLDKYMRLISANAQILQSTTPTTVTSMVITHDDTASVTCSITIQFYGPSSSSSSLPLGGAASFALLASSAITNTGSSVITGDIGTSPGTSITGFPPGTFSGQEHIADSTSQKAQVDATAAFNAMQTQGLAGTVIPSALDGQTLVPGAYQFTSGAATLAQSGNGTLTFNGQGQYIIYTASTLTTGAGGIPTMTLTNGAKASDIYFVVNSSATINSGSAGTFQGSILSKVSITDTLGGIVNGHLIALTGAITLSAATTASVAPVPALSAAEIDSGATVLLTSILKNSTV